MPVLAPLAFTLAFALSSAPRAEAPPPEPPRALAHTSPRALALQVGGAAAFLAIAHFAIGDRATTCGWCETNAFDRAIRDALVADDSKTPALVSHILSFGVAPAMALGLTAAPAIRSGYARYAIEDAAIIASAVAFTLGVTTATKELADRQRPAYHYGRGAETEYGAGSSEAFVSFFSGDSSLAFVLGSSSATIAYLRGYRTAPWIAGVGAAVAVSTGLLRMVADMHWATDVLTGAAVGTGIGIGLPLLWHRPVGRDRPLVMPWVVPGSAGVGLAAAF